MDASSVVLGVVLEQLGEGDLDHPIAFASWKLSFVEKKIYHHREGRSGDGICATKIWALPIGWSFQNVHGPFCFEIPGK